MLGCLTLESKLRPNKVFNLGYGCRSVAGYLCNTQGLSLTPNTRKWEKSYEGVNDTAGTSAFGRWQQEYQEFRVPQLYSEYK